MAKKCNYKVYDGTDWVDPCQTEIRILRPNATPASAPHGTFELLDPEDRVIKYYDGGSWVRMRCIEPECFCPTGYTKNSVTGLCEKSVPAFFDGTLTVIGRGGSHTTYGQGGLLLYNKVTWNQTIGITQNNQTQLFYGSALNPINSTGTFLSPLWKDRLIDCGIAQYVHLGWNRKLAYNVGTIVCAYEPASATFKKYTCISSVTANNISPFNPSPVDDTVHWGPGQILTYSDVAVASPQNNKTCEFQYCLTLTESKTYHVGLAGDNSCDIKLQINSSGSYVNLINVGENVITNFYNWYVVPIELPAGNHKLRIKGVDTGGIASNGIEIYDMSLTGSTDPIEKFKEEFLYAPGSTSIDPTPHSGDTYTKLEPYVIFSTNLMVNKSIPIPNEIDPATGQPYVPYCADGTTADFCNGAPVCPITTPCSDTPIP